LTEVASSADSALQSVTQALASGNGTTLMASLQAAFSSAVEGLNSTFNGEYLFAGGQVNTQPVTAAALSDLTAGPIGSLFHNDQRVASTQLDQNTSVSTGFLASNVGTPLFQALAAIEAYNQGPNGPITGNLTTAQATFLTSQVSNLDAVEASLNNVAAQNGQAQNVVTNAQTDLTQRQTMLQNLVGNITSAGMAQAVTNLQQAQLSIQAAGQVFQALNSASLLNSLSVTPSIG
jgi:flagellar hook-associated protein 3 FlgL